MSAIVDAAAASTAKLPLWATIRLSYATYFRHFRDGLRITALWLPLVAALNAVAGWQQAFWLREMLANPQTQVTLAQSADLVILNYVAGLALGCAAISIAVAWHRLLLLNETPRLSGSNFFTGSLWRYVGIGIVISVIGALPLVAALVPLSLLRMLPSIGSAPPAVIAVIVLAYVIGIVLMLRLCLLLPARAAGDLNLTFKNAWRRSRGNLWRIFCGILACGIPPFLLTKLAFLAVISVPLAADAYLAQWAAGSAIGIGCWLLTWPIWVGFLSHAYRRLSSAA
jgi:hypothetical protein